MKKLDELLADEIIRLDAYCSYPNLDDFVVYKDATIHATGIKVKGNREILTSLKRLPDKSGFAAVYDLLEPMNILA